MKNIVLLLGIVILFHGCGSNKNLAPDFSVKEIVTDDGHVIKKEGTGNSGFVRSYKDGKQDGLTRLYRNGKITGEISFKNGLRDGMTHCYGIYPCSLSDTSYKNGKKHGVEKLYYSKGVPKSVTAYKNGQKHGLEKEWYGKSHKISSIISYADGKKEGLSRTYYENGKLEIETSYEKGKRYGLQKWYGRDEKLMKTLFYKENKKHGVVKTYNKKGEVTSSVEYKNGKQIGTIKSVDFTDYSWVNTIKSYGTLTPVQEKTHSRNWKEVSVHDRYFVAVKKDGTLWSFGNVSLKPFAGLGCGNDITLLKKLKEKRVPQVLPMQIGTDKDWQSVIAGDGYVLARKNDGTLWGWGRGLIDIKGKKITTSIPVRVRNKSSKVDFYKTEATVKPDGTLWMRSDRGQLIDGKRVIVSVQEQSKSKAWVWASVHSYYGVALKRDGTLWWWGRF